MLNHPNLNIFTLPEIAHSSPFIIIEEEGVKNRTFAEKPDTIDLQRPEKRRKLILTLIEKISNM